MDKDVKEDAVPSTDKWESEVKTDLMQISMGPYQINVFMYVYKNHPKMQVTTQNHEFTWGSFPTPPDPQMIPMIIMSIISSTPKKELTFH